MSDVLKPQNQYMIQKNAISRSIYSCSAMSRKIIAMSMSLLPLNKENDYTISFEISDFIKALNIADGTKTRLLVKKAIADVVDTKIIIADVENFETEEFTYIGFQWFTKWHFESKTGVCKLSFNSELAEYLKTMQGYTKMNLQKLGKLQSMYAIRYYEIALSYSGFAGKKGNRYNEWWFEYSVEDLRAVFNLDSKKYKEKNAFRRKCVDNPIAEINQNDVGFKIHIDYIRKGKSLVGFKFHCMYDSQTEKIANNDYTETLTEKENETLKLKYPLEFAQYYEEEMQQLDLFGFGGELVKQMSAETNACNRLRKEKGIQK